MGLMDRWRGLRLWLARCACLSRLGKLWQAGETVVSGRSMERFVASGSLGEFSGEAT